MHWGRFTVYPVYGLPAAGVDVPVGMLVVGVVVGVVVGRVVGVVVADPGLVGEK